MEELKLYVWKDVFWLWRGGVAFALASSVENAKIEIAKSFAAERGCSVADIMTTIDWELGGEEPEIHDGPYGFYKYGSE
jgi:hypothetical protein